MNKQEFVDFLESYRVLLKLENSQWKHIQYHDNSMLFAIEMNGYSNKEEHPEFEYLFRIDFNNENASLNFTDNYNIVRYLTGTRKITKNLVELLSEEFESYNCLKFKTEYFKFGGGSVMIKSDYKSIIEMLTIGIDKVNAIL